MEGDVMMWERMTVMSNQTRGLREPNLFNDYKVRNIFIAGNRDARTAFTLQLFNSQDKICRQILTFSFQNS